MECLARLVTGLGVQQRQVEAQIKLQLVVSGFHMLTQLVKGLVVLFSPQVGQFVYHYHLEKGVWGRPEQSRNLNFGLGLELVALHSRDGGV